MKKIKFLKYKYGKELLIDCRTFSESPNFVFHETPYTADFYEMFFVTKGNATLFLDDEEILLNKRKFVFLPPHKRRLWQPIKKAIDGYFLLFESEFISNFFQDTFFIHRFHFFHNVDTPSFIKAEKSTFDKTIETLGEIRAEMLSLQDDSHHMLRSLLYYLLINLNRYYAEVNNITSVHYKNNIALQFKKILETNFSENFSVQKFADIIGISRTHLNNEIKKSFGKTATQMISERLLIEAKRELLFTNKTSAEISYQLNFSDPSNFLRFFKNQTGYSTKEFRSGFSK